MKQRNILVACNELDYILIHKTLQGNYILHRAESGEDILRLISRKPYDLLLIDVDILKFYYPVFAGIREEHIPVIALSSEPFDARNEDIKRRGCCACYVKPIRPEVFIAFIDYWISEYQK